MNKKGFAISIIMYSILIMFIVLLISIMGVLASRKMLLDKSKKDVVSFLNAQESTITATSETNEVEYGIDNLLPGKFFETESTSVECTIDNIIYNNTDSLEEGEYTVKCAIKYEEIEYASATTVIKIVDNTFEYTKDFTYKGAYEEWIVPKTGYYQVELWGGSGNLGYSPRQSRGSYTVGKIKLEKNEVYYLYIGGGATSTSTVLNFNGGTDGGAGGASDIRCFSDASQKCIANSTDLAWNNTLGLNSRIMVAASGGGTWGDSSGGYGGNGGDLTGDAGTCSTASNCGGGGTQTGPGSNGYNGSSGGFGIPGTSSSHLGGGNGYYGGGGGHSGGGWL